MHLLDSPWLPVFIYFARIGDVSISTLRVLSIMRGKRALAVTLGFFEILIWIFAASSVLTRLDRWLNIIAYAAGFASGNAVGMWLESKLAMGVQIVTLMSRGKAHAVAERLRFGEIHVTTMSGQGHFGPVAICTAIVPRKQARRVIAMAREVDPEVVFTIEDTRETTPIGLYAPGAGKTPLALQELLTGWGAVRFLGAKTRKKGSGAQTKAEA